MRTLYNDLDIKLKIGDTSFYALNIVFERFLHSIPSHSHSDSSYEIHYIPYGHGQVTINNAVYDVKPNTLYVTGPHVEHKQIPFKEDPMAEYCIYFKIERKNLSKRCSRNSSITSLFEETKIWFGYDSQNIHALMQAIFYELENKYTGYMVQVEALLQQLIVKMIRNYENKREPGKHPESSNLADSKYLIIEECFLYEYRDITLEKLSARLGLSSRQTERLLKQHYGKTFLQKKAEAKMSAASILLLDDTKSITDISDDLGYSSVEHFSSAFKRYYHISARDYRKKLAENTKKSHDKQ